MKVLGIVGSPRRERGIGHRVVTRVLEGARSAGAETELLYLVDEHPQYCIHCGHSCFQEGDCAQEEQATARSRLIGSAEALVLAAPVYVWQVNGLTAAFLEKLRLDFGSWVRGHEHGRYALGIAVAGGTGTGVFPALQALYSALCHWKYRPLDPLPVTRFNLDGALEAATSLGWALAERRPQPYADTAELLAAYDSLPYLRYSHIDEFHWLAEQIAAGLEAKGGYEETVRAIRDQVAEGHALAARGNGLAAARQFVAAYRLGLSSWP